MIRFLDLRAQYKSIQGEIDLAIAKVLDDAQFIGGQSVATFERSFANYLEVGSCVGVGNGTDALEIALEALNLPPNSEVIVPANSFVATAEAVVRSGHKPVFADVCSESFTLDPLDVERRITKVTKALIPVHLYGHPCNMYALNELAEKHQLAVIEDCAQAHGAAIDGKKVGSFSRLACFSFYPGKNLGAYGDGGAIVGDDLQLLDECRALANHGRRDKFDHRRVGRNSRLDALQAAVLAIKLNHLEKWVDHRNELADVYNDYFRNCNGIVPPTVADNVRHAFHLYVVRSRSRATLVEALDKEQIEYGFHYPISIPNLEAFRYLNQGGEQKFGWTIADEILSLPIGEHLDTDDIQLVAQTAMGIDR